MPDADDTTIAFLTDNFATIEAKDLDRLGTFYADDMTLTFGNAPTVSGRRTALAQMTELLGNVESLAHPLVNVWREDDGVVVLEVASVWRFPDGTETTINACSIFTIRAGQFADQRIYVDNGPIEP